MNQKTGNVRQRIQMAKQSSSMLIAGNNLAMFKQMDAEAQGQGKIR